jgi:hypothetical protein
MFIHFLLVASPRCDLHDGASMHIVLVLEVYQYPTFNAISCIPYVILLAQSKILGLCIGNNTIYHVRLC